MPASVTPYIRFDQVEVRYTKHVYGLQEVSLEISRGEFVFFCGRTGAGKSTLLRLLSRELDASNGSIQLAGREISKLRGGAIAQLRRELGIVPQDFALLPRKRVWENVAYAMRAIGHTRREVRKRVPEILERVQIGHRADAYPHELSGGEQQRVAIGRALINNPPLLLADEPTGNLDPEHSWEIMELLSQLNLRGTTVLVASHDQVVVDRMRKRLVRMESGRIVSDSGTQIQPTLIAAMGPMQHGPPDDEPSEDGEPETEVSGEVEEADVRPD
jgi:cell division transport system ATP-binding protein